MTTTIFNTVQRLNENYLEINFSCSDVITQPLFCPKSEVEIGYVEVSLYKQEKHGFYREVIWDRVSKLGLCLNGEPFGVAWNRLDGDAFLVTSNGKFMTYLYPDLSSAIHGELDKNGNLKNGQFSQLCDFTCDPGGGLPLPKVRLHDISSKYNYDLSRLVIYFKDD